MANPIRRVVQLVLDKIAAKRVETDAKKALGGVETGLNKLKSAALGVGAALAAAFSLALLTRFGRESVRAASEAQRVWNDLAGTVDNAGESFKGLEKDIRAAAEAMQDATMFEGEDYAAGLTRMISLTGNVQASMANMGLAANVAAQFFGGELGPAVDLVAKVSMGMTTQLKRMGIEVTSAQEGLDVLATRSLGAAERQLNTVSGRLRVLNNYWGDFKEAVGDALIAGADGTDVITTLTNAVKVMIGWVQRNQHAISEWIVKGFHAVVIAVDGTYRAIRGLGELLVGTFMTALGGVTYGVTQATLAFVALFDAVNAIPKFLGSKAAAALGFDGIASNIENVTTKLKENLRGLRDWGAAVAKGGIGTIGQGARRIATQSGLATSLLAPPSGARTGFTAGTPVVVGGGTEEGDPEAAKVKVDAVAESFKKLSEAMQLSQGMWTLLGEEYDLNGAKTAYLTAHMQELLSAGFDPMSPYLQGVVAELESLRVEEDRVALATAAFTNEMASIDTMASIMGSDFDSLGAKAGALETVIRSLADMGFKASDPILAGYIDQLRKVKEAMGASKKEAENYAIAVSNTQSLIVGALGGTLAEVAKAKAKENLLLAAEQTAHGIVSLLNPLTAGKAIGHFTQAATFTGIAAGWAALSAATGGGGGATGGGGSGGLGGARGASGEASERAEPPGTEVHIHMKGDFDAMNPRVQAFVMSSLEQGVERYGPNTKPILHTGGD